MAAESSWLGGDVGEQFLLAATAQNLQIFVKAKLIKDLSNLATQSTRPCSNWTR